MKTTRWMLTVSLGLCLAGCAERQGIDRLVMEHRVNPDPALALEFELQKPPQWASPARLGIFLVTRNFPPFRTVRQASWTSAHKERLKARLTSLLVPGPVSDVFLLEDPLIRGFDPAAIRQAGRRYGADAVLVVDGVAAVDRFNNTSAGWYATLLGAYLASGTEVDAAFLARGTLHDVPTDRLYGAQTAEGRAERKGPAMLVEDGAVLGEAQDAALEQLATAIAQDIRRLSGTTAPSR